ncbi:MAG TPA: ABC transporter ATP-binding protein [Candidatus Marinimicrobia bacterium]|nr:ABC transporter ATP-binding protein [Candidatus Neomarinimicrobiota bacterium]
MTYVLKWFKRYWRHRWKGMTAVLIVTILGIAVKTLYPYIFKFIVDGLAQDIDLTNVRSWILIILSVGILREITQWLLPAMRFMMNLRIAKDMRSEHFRAVLKMRPAIFQNYRTGDLITRLTDDIDGDLKLSWYSASGIMRPIEAGLTLSFSIILMLTLSWKLTLIAMSPLPIVIWLIARTESIQEKAYSQRQKRTSETVDLLESAFSGIRIIIGSAAEAAQSGQFNKTIAKRIRSEEKVVLIRSFLESFGSMINQIGLVIVIFAGSFFVLQGHISLGDFYAFVAYLGGLTETIWTISWFFVSTKLAETSVYRLKELSETQDSQENNRDFREYEGEEIREILATERPATKMNAIIAENLSFRYQKEQALLENINLSIGLGKIIAIVGPVACGKSTLLELIAGILEPSSGKIRIGAKSISRLSAEEKARLFGYVPQDLSLFSGNLNDNITLGRMELTDELWQDIKKAAVFDPELIQAKEISQGGVGLSGGQRARLALARAIAHKPQILLLDDVTSALDAKTERLFWNEIRRYLPKTTIIAATHREATAATADQVIWLNNHTISAIDQHHKLLDANPAYRRLFAKAG